MSTIPPPYDWSKRVLEDWTSQGGLESIRQAVKKNVNFEPDPFQLKGAARILQGQDVFVISATGDGKSAMIFIPPMVREGTISMVISPTNYLEMDMVSNCRHPKDDCLYALTGIGTREKRCLITK
jgi:superfamily II DNA/RNA helicase